MTQPYAEESFDPLARGYNARAIEIGNQNNAVFGAVLGRLAPVQSDMRDISLIDLGIGTGNTVLEAKKHLTLGRIVGIDASLGMLHEAEQNLSAAGLPFEAMQGPLTDCLATLPGQFNIVSSISVLEFIADHDELFQRVSDKLRPSGMFIFNYLPIISGHPELNEPQLTFRHPTTGMEATIYRQHPQSVVNMLGRCGLAIIDQELYCPQSSSLDKVAIMIVATKGNLTAPSNGVGTS